MISAEPFVVKCRTLNQRWRLWMFSDLHLGSKACMENQIDAFIKELKDDPYSLWLGGGDYAECIDVRDRRFDSREVAREKRHIFFDNMSKNIVDMLVEKFKPIKKKCVGLLRGNHEDTYEVNHSTALVQTICEELDVRYLDYCTAFDLVFKAPRKQTESFKVWAHHGAGFAATTGGKINKLKKAMTEVFDADIYLMGHMHEQLTHSQPMLAQDAGGELQSREKLGIVSGAYMATYRDGGSTYGEKKMYSPVALGSVAVTILPASRRLGTEKWK